MSEQNVSPVLKQVLELGPTVAFFLIYRSIKDETYVVAGTEYEGFIAATVLFIPILLAAMGVLWWLNGKLSRIHLFTLFMVLLFGALTVWFNDEKFFKMKTTIVYGSMAAVLAVGLLMGKSFVKTLLVDFIDMEDEGWMKFAQGLVVINTLMAVSNEFIWRTMSTETWVTLETFVLPAISVTLTLGLIIALQKYLIEPEED